jgi:hypothetical protein
MKKAKDRMSLFSADWTNKTQKRVIILRNLLAAWLRITESGIFCGTFCMQW